MKKFSRLSKREVYKLIDELDNAEISGIPAKGSRNWYLMEFAYWLLGEIIAGRINLPKDE